MGHVGITLGLIYVAIVVVLYFLQDALIFPGRSSQGRPESALRLGPDYQIVELRTPKGQRVTAVFGSALSPGGSPLADAASRPTILYFYGNGEWIAGSIGKVGSLRRRGLNVLMPDFLGYGSSEGVAGEAGCIAAADAAYEHLLTRTDIDPRENPLRRVLDGRRRRDRPGLAQALEGRDRLVYVHEPDGDGRTAISVRPGEMAASPSLPQPRQDRARSPPRS